MKLTVKDISRQAIIVVLYFVFTLITYPISFLGIQFRIAEMLIFLCFFRKDYIIGITIGCVLANLTSAIGFIDAAIGGAATFLSCLIIIFSKRLLPCIFTTTIINAFLVGFELNYFIGEPFWVSVGFVALGEFVVLLVGYVLYRILSKKQKFYEIIYANQNIDFKW